MQAGLLSHPLHRVAHFPQVFILLLSQGASITCTGFLLALEEDRGTGKLPSDSFGIGPVTHNTYSKTNQAGLGWKALLMQGLPVLPHVITISKRDNEQPINNQIVLKNTQLLTLDLYSTDGKLTS